MKSRMCAQISFVALLVSIVLLCAIVGAQAFSSPSSSLNPGRPTSQSGKSLQFRSDGTFKIVQFTDLHYGETELNDVRSVLVQEEVLKREEPDLTVMTGDSVSGYAWKGQTGWFAEKWEHLSSPMAKYNATWAFAIGNHDDEADLNRTMIMNLLQTYNLSLTQEGPSDIHGVTNYYLFVYSSDPNNDVPVAVLYFFDSSDTNCENVQGWGCVYPDQIQWYANTSSSITKQFGKIIPALAFFHIPPPEFMYMWNNLTTYGRLQDTGVCCFSVNTGLFAAFKQMGDVISVHCGHDHDNDFYGEFDGILLAYGRKTGYGGYGPPLGWKRGARVLQLTENPFSLTHWIREQDGNVVPSTSQPTHPPVPSKWTHCCGTVSSPRSNCMEYAHSFEENLGRLH